MNKGQIEDFEPIDWNAFWKAYLAFCVFILGGVAIYVEFLKLIGMI